MKDKAIDEILQNLVERFYYHPKVLPQATQQIQAEIQKQVTLGKIAEVYAYLERSDSLGESKYATRRIEELTKELGEATS